MYDSTKIEDTYSAWKDCIGILASENLCVSKEFIVQIINGNITISGKAEIKGRNSNPITELITINIPSTISNKINLTDKKSEFLAWSIRLAVKKIGYNI